MHAQNVLTLFLIQDMQAAEIYMSNEKEGAAAGILNEILQENPDTIIQTSQSFTTTSAAFTWT